MESPDDFEGTGRIIVKVQLPLAATEENPPALVYNEDRTIQEEMPVDQALLDAMGGAHKKFFYASLKGKTLELEEEAPWQEW